MKLKDLVPGVTFLYDPIPPGNINRPAYPLQATRITIHENGNPNPNVDAYHERDFTHGGGGDDTASYHFAVSSNNVTGDTIIQLLPLNENGWHAGDKASGPGNRTSLAIEHCQWGNFDRTLLLGQALCAALLSEPEQFAGGQACRFYPTVDEALVQHAYWTGKNCPEYIRRRGLWTAYKQAVARLLTKPATASYDGLDRHLPLPWGGRATLRAVDRVIVLRRDAGRYAIAKTGVVPTGERERSGTHLRAYYSTKINQQWYYVLSDQSLIRETDCTHRVRVYRIKDAN